MPQRPNFVIFMPDQLRADCIGAFGNPVIRTPNIDELAARGTKFRQAYAQHSVCSQSRASILTGWYPHVAGHRTLTNLLKPWEPNLFRSLKDSGYNVAWLGQRGDTFAPGVVELSTDFYGWLEQPKMRRMPPPFAPGSKWYRSFYHGRRGDEHLVNGVAIDFDEAATRSAEQWLANAPKEPWVLFVALIFPHPPFEVEEPWFSMYDRAAMPPPISAGLGDKPAFMRELLQRTGNEALDPPDWAELVATYYGMISRVDAQLGRVMRAVERAGVADNTATLFFADHGEYLGDFGMVEKWPSGLHESLVRDPLIIAAPGMTGGQTCDSLVELVDILPTVLELAGVEAQHTHFGRSLVPLLHDATLPHRDAAFSEGGFTLAEQHLLESGAGFPYDIKQALQHEHPESVGKATAMRTERWTYVHRLYEGNELYDRRADPGETHNLAGTPEMESVERDLREKMLDWLIATSDVIPWQEDPRR